ncbi:VWA domain-containing protein [Vibrio sp. HN007]|uniref:vWA domain-containing protein n=1 Tax=Vibrio iocasae TaxID=3098914 RepID=UPI0035D3EE19
MDLMILKQILFQFHFIRPFWLLTFLPLAAVVYLRWNRDEQKSWQKILPPHLREALTVGDKGWKKQLPLKVLTSILSLAIIVCAGPTWQRESSPFGEDKAPLLILLDTSESMLQKDLPPSRLERSKQKILDLLALRSGGKTSLVVYSGSAHLAMPFTQDTEVFKPILSAIDPTIMPRDGKRLKTTLPIIDKLMEETDVVGSVLLISDGISPDDQQQFKSYFEGKPYQLLIMAAGNSKRSSDLPFDYQSLKQLANSTGGYITKPSVDHSDIEWLDNRIQRHMQLSNDLATPWKDMGYYLVFPLALVILLWFRKGWLVQWCLVTTLLSASTLLYSQPTYASLVQAKAADISESNEVTLKDKAIQFWLDLWLTPDQQGQYYFNDKQYLKSARAYDDPMKKAKAYYYAEEFESAHTLFMQLSTEEARFNAANALVGMREYIAARSVYLELVKSNPNNTAAAHNLKIIESVIKQINEFSRSQAESMEGSQESSQELPDDKPQTADGAEEQVTKEITIKEILSADEILQNDAVANKWLKRVEADPKQFLRAKFQMQLNDSLGVNHSLEN